MTTHSYGKRDYAFGQAVVTLRTTMHLTQVELARFLGVSRAAVLGWEAGSSYPKVANLKRFIALGVQRHAFAAGRLEEESGWAPARQWRLRWAYLGMGDAGNPTGHLRCDPHWAYQLGAGTGFCPRWNPTCQRELGSDRQAMGRGQRTLSPHV